MLFTIIRRASRLGSSIATEMKEYSHSNVAPPPLEEEMALPEESRMLQIPVGEVALTGDLEIPEKARGLVLFAHGSGSSRRSPRNQAVAEVLRDAGLATLLFDLLTQEEEVQDAYTGHLRFDIGMLSRRLVLVTEEIADDPVSRNFGYRLLRCEHWRRGRLARGGGARLNDRRGRLAWRQTGPGR